MTGVVPCRSSVGRPDQMGHWAGSCKAASICGEQEDQIRSSNYLCRSDWEGWQAEVVPQELDDEPAPVRPARKVMSRSRVRAARHSPDSDTAGERLCRRAASMRWVTSHCCTSCLLSGK